MRGLKLVSIRVKPFREVASFTDAWIETLKYSRDFIQLPVASFTDAWIETTEGDQPDLIREVASFTDAWIETHWYEMSEDSIWSHLLQMRGLKP